MTPGSRRDRFTWEPQDLERPEPCEPEPHEPHADEHGSCPGVPAPEAER